MGIRLLPSGDSSIVIEFGDKIDPELNKKVRFMFLSMIEANIPSVTELIPTYRSLYVQYDPLTTCLEELKKQLLKVISRLDEVTFPPPRTVEIPTLYGGDYGPDLELVAEHNKLTPDEVVKIHTSMDYLVYMIGFTPGFAYLGGMSNMIATPRLETPRLKVPAGSVGIAGEQTGIYPIESPGGWNIIGKTPIKLFNIKTDPPSTLQSSDYVRFVKIDKKEYKRIQNQIEMGIYNIRIYLQEVE